MTSREQIIERIEKMAKPILASMGLDLVEIAYSSGGQRGLLRVFIDKPQGVTLEDCQKLSEYLGHALDVEDPIPVRYTLEVSSPGLNRPLKGKVDFNRQIGKRVRVTTRDAIDGANFFTGRLAAVEESGIALTLDEGKTVTIPLEQVARASLEIEFQRQR